MTDFLHAVLLGMVQGATEFLPVSSSGHLLIAKEVFGISAEKFGLPFDVALHLGLSWQSLSSLVTLTAAWLRSAYSRNWNLSTDSRLAWLLVLATGNQRRAGQVVASVGESETLESLTAPGTDYHLHFEVRTGESFFSKNLSPQEVRRLYQRLYP